MKDYHDREPDVDTQNLRAWVRKKDEIKPENIDERFTMAVDSEKGEEFLESRVYTPKYKNAHVDFKILSKIDREGKVTAIIKVIFERTNKVRAGKRVFNSIFDYQQELERIEDQFKELFFVKHPRIAHYKEFKNVQAEITKKREG